MELFLTPSTMSKMADLCLDSPGDVVPITATSPTSHDVQNVVFPRSLTFDDDDSRDSGFESHDSDNEASPANRQLAPFSILSTPNPRYVRRSLFSGKRSHCFEDSPAKKVRCDDLIDLDDNKIPVTSTVTSIKSVVDKMESEENLIGDGSTGHILPTIPGRHKDLKSVSPDTVSHFLEGTYSDVISSYKIIDCRYPYEYEGGHIEGAINLHNEELITDMMTKHLNDSLTERNILIFHCEFSSERGPKLLRHLRSLDRKMNSDRYPYLFYPEVYLLDGGYKSFYEQHQIQCKPESYRPMLHEDFSSELRHFRSRSKSQKSVKRRWNHSQRAQCDASPLKCILW